MIRIVFNPLRLVSFAALAAPLVLAGCNRAERVAAPEASPAIAESAAPASSPAISANTLTADGLGAIRIGQTVAEVEAAVGAPATPILKPEDCNIFHPARAPEGVFVMTEEGRVTRISLRQGASVQTDRGFGVGAEASAITAAYGGGVVAQPAKYDAAPAEDLFVWVKGGSTAYVTDPTARGVRYEVGTDGKVKTIHAGGPSIQLVENCG